MTKVQVNGTKERIATAIEKLLDERPLSKISVTDIVKECDLSRKTFYRHFEDIYDLLIWFYESENTAREVFYRTKDFKKGLLHALNTFKKHPSLYRKLFLSGDKLFIEKYIRSRIELPKQHIGTAHLSPEVCYALQLFWAGHTYAIIRWMEDGMKESPEMLTEYATLSLPEILKELYRV